MNENDIQKNLLKAKPKSEHDPAFAAGLRAQLLSDFGKKMSTPKTNSFFFMFKNMRYAIAGLAVLVVAGIGVFASIHQKSGTPSSDVLASNITVTKVQSEAFGSLGTLSTGKSADTTNGGNETSGAGAGTSGATAPSAAMAPAKMNSAAVSGAPAMIVGGSGSSGASGSAIAMPIQPPYYYPSVKYVYKGATFSQDQTQLDVLKYIPTPYSADQVSAALGKANFGGFDLSTFNNVDVTNITLSENKDFGYQMYIDLANGTLSISENYLKWQQNTGTSPNSQNSKPKKKSDDAVIAIANQFLSDHHISRASFGDPEIIQQIYAVPMMGAATPAGTTNVAPDVSVKTNMPMIPYYGNSEEVLYPLMVNGRIVYSSNGSKVGLTMQVDLGYNRVTNVYGISTQNYDASAYNAITDVNTILSLAENPQFYPIMYEGVMSSGSVGGANGSSASNQIVPAQTEVDLGTPTMALVQMYQSDSNEQSNEYLVPAYIFPITSNSSGSTDQNIVVPLIKDFAPQTSTILPRPLPPTIKNPTPAK